jgi:thioredoxin reductase (NADPH)
VGGGDSAVDEALTLTSYASRVILFHRRDRLRAQRVLQDRLLNHPKVEVRWNTVVEAVLGDERVTGIQARDVATGQTTQVELSGLFIYIGLSPNTRFLQGFLRLDNAGHIPVNLWMETEVPGVFAAGDVRQHSASQLVTAAGDGATAAIAAHRYIEGRQWDG